MKKYLILCLGVLVLTGCGSSTEVSDSNSSNEENNSVVEKEGYSITINDTQIMVGDEFSSISSKLGDDYEYQEIESCAFGDLDKIYTYTNYEIYNYTEDEQEIIYTITLLTEDISTDENIKIGSTIDEVVDSYGDDYQDEYGAYVYTKGDTILTFIFEDDAVVSIEYKLNIEE